ncbi:MAG: DNA-binding protein [Limnospira sp. PMC 1240.20]|uniref:DNA-binding protein n=2 Tax=unclassified Limnospira TaxID=2642885 RepID=UPI0028E13C4F|nr:MULTISPECIES: DNA-binding protein [unclassified Limnospira]MDT9178056.1 DNA-binding protein [Limnospira sp. PMC 1238.20]MDT9193254.1 DNA-binding protein [Limnospira sp. PMC 1245.20]MDT9208679.1 DNA-binding protein [Limnospira sp. PMC 1252.20]MDT9213889.1 DNA-binding protein [Limnospira sp. PMC 1256.20]MDT9239411.1 DNA-binding protein [Limnospira sp. PMC 1261.20]MDT9249758.1 DNA-binding protein [Limnospira sp. PMC 1280.21]MDT9254894.1 DNA-binding protein [Limnospira sp. PMC 1254.20]MDT925
MYQCQRIGRMWVIPLTGEMPEITPGGRGPKPTWQCSRPKNKPTYIHINKKVIGKNNHILRETQGEIGDIQQLLQPPIILNKGNKTLYASEIIIDGPCRLLYQPFKKLCSGAQVWIETLFPTRTIAL